MAVAAVLVSMTLTAARGTARTVLPRAALFASIVALLVVGRATLVHRYHGVSDFGLGTKGTVNLLVGLAKTDRDRERVATAVGADGRNDLSQRAAETTLVGFALAQPMLFARHVGGNLLRLAASTMRVFPFVPLAGGRRAPWAGGWPPLLAIAALATTALAGLGVVRALREPEARPGSALLVATAALYLLGLAPLFVHDRLVVSLVPLFLVFLAYGVVRRHPRRAGQRAPPPLVAAGARGAGRRALAHHPPPGLDSRLRGRSRRPA